MNTKLKNSGFSKPVITVDQYVLGNLQVPLVPLKTDSDWSDSRQKIEYQSTSDFDTFNCTSFNTLNQIEEYMLVAFNEVLIIPTGGLVLLLEQNHRGMTHKQYMKQLESTDLYQKKCYHFRMI